MIPIRTRGPAQPSQRPRACWGGSCRACGLGEAPSFTKRALPPPARRRPGMGLPTRGRDLLGFRFCCTDIAMLFQD